MTNYEKLKVSLRYFLLGKEYYVAADALEFAASYHTGFRKDGVTLEFEHQLRIAHYVRSLLPSLYLPQETIATALLHDVCEDYNVSNEMIVERFGDLYAAGLVALNKNGEDGPKSLTEYYEVIAGCPVCSVVKGADRIHNVQTMVGVFTTEKQIHYINETEQFVLPMLKNARRLYPEQEPAYENIKHVLLSQLELIKAIHAQE